MLFSGEHDVRHPQDSFTTGARPAGAPTNRNNAFNSTPLLYKNIYSMEPLHSTYSEVYLLTPTCWTKKRGCCKRQDMIESIKREFLRDTAAQQLREYLGQEGFHMQHESHPDLYRRFSAKLSGKQSVW